jgi:hypothetical protein
MNYSEAVELLGLTTPKSLAENARLASMVYDRMTLEVPWRYKAAAMVIIRAAAEPIQRGTAPHRRIG